MHMMAIHRSFHQEHRSRIRMPEPLRGMIIFRSSDPRLHLHHRGVIRHRMMHRAQTAKRNSLGRDWRGSSNMASARQLGLFLHRQRAFASPTSARLCRTWFISSTYIALSGSPILPFLATNDPCLRLQDRILMARSRSLQMEALAVTG